LLSQKSKTTQKKTCRSSKTLPTAKGTLLHIDISLNVPFFLGQQPNLHFC
jgi:hypothetical protein